MAILSTATETMQTLAHTAPVLCIFPVTPQS